MIKKHFHIKFEKQPFADVFKIGVLKSFEIFKGKHPWWIY